MTVAAIDGLGVPDDGRLPMKLLPCSFAVSALLGSARIADWDERKPPAGILTRGQEAVRLPATGSHTGRACDQESGRVEPREESMGEGLRLIRQRASAQR